MPIAESSSRRQPPGCPDNRFWTSASDTHRYLVIPAFREQRSANRQNPDYWNLERPACFEIIPTARAVRRCRQVRPSRDHHVAILSEKQNGGRRLKAHGVCEPSSTFIKGG